MKKLIKIALFIFTVFVIISALKKTDIINIILKRLYPIKYSEYVEKYAEEFDVDKNLIYAIIKVESNFNPEVKSSKEAIGLMQIMKSTAEETAEKLKIEVDNLYEPEVNIRLGVKYFRDLIDTFNGNYKLAIVAYNAGMGNVNNWIQEGIIRRRCL